MARFKTVDRLTGIFETMSNLLTKSDFKVARSCSAKLWYRKNGFPSVNDRNRYLALLADAGMIVQSMARLYYPEAVFPPDRNQAVAWTLEQLKKEHVSLFEAPFETATRHIRTDILVKQSDQLEIIEVKSRGVDVEEILESPYKRRRTMSKLRDLIEDLAFQKLVIATCFPTLNIRCSLFLPDKNRLNPIDGLADQFAMQQITDAHGYTFLDAVFTGNRKEILASEIIVKIDVSEEVDQLLEEMNAEAMKLEIQLQSADRPQPPLGCFCRDCEFTVKNENFPHSGFELCWKSGAHSHPHILDLSQLGNVNTEGRVDALIRAGKSSLNDIPEAWLRDKWGNRPWLQRSHATPVMFEGFHRAIADVQWTLHFIDFETAQPALPNFAGMKPYQKLLFQWSCHRLDSAAAQPMHTSWLHTDDKKPNQQFLISLRAALGDEGSILTWSAYEQGVLRALMQEQETTTEQKQWIQQALLRIRDMNQWAMKFYFHPETGGRTSIKVTLPAVLSSSRSPKTTQWLQELHVLAFDEYKNIINPYEQLPKLDLPGLDGGVHDGTGAMIAYHYLHHGPDATNDTIRALYCNALLQYCQLDTLAMLIIWEEWLLMDETDVHQLN